MTMPRAVEKSQTYPVRCSIVSTSPATRSSTASLTQNALGRSNTIILRALRCEDPLRPGCERYIYLVLAVKLSNIFHKNRNRLRYESGIVSVRCFRYGSPESTCPLRNNHMPRLTNEGYDVVPPEPAALVQPFKVCVTLYVPAALTVILLPV